jgi:hypothetical protein
MHAPVESASTCATTIATMMTVSLRERDGAIERDATQRAPVAP